MTTLAGLRLLTSDEFDLLTDEEQADYVSLLDELEIQWKLQARQAWADMLADVCDEVLFGGALGGGKSELVVYRAHQLSKRFPRHSSLILRESFPQLKRSIIRRSIMRIPQGEAKYRAGDKEWRYPNGSIIELGYLDTDEDVRNYLSAQYDAIFIDEATSFTVYQVVMVGSRLRTTTDQTAVGVRPHLFLTTNPGGPGHAFCKHRYVDATRHGTHLAIYRAQDSPDDPSTNATDVLELPPLPQHPEDWDAVEALRTQLHHLPAIAADQVLVAFIPSALEDNRYIDKTYRRMVSRLPAIERRQAQGDWDVFAGQFFSEFSHEAHVIPPFPIPPSWYRARGLDFGFAAPYACVWAAWDGDGNCYVYREAYETRLTPSMQAAQVRSMSVCVDDKERVIPEDIRMTVADPSVFNKNGMGDAVATQWLRAGLNVRRANSARVDGWSNVREYLRVDPDTGKPRLFFFETCPNTIRTLPDMVYSKQNPEDLDSHTEDHLPDALRYVLAVRPMRTINRRRSRLTGLEAAAARDLQRMRSRRQAKRSSWRIS